MMMIKKMMVIKIMTKIRKLPASVKVYTDGQSDGDNDDNDNKLKNRWAIR